jgi:hypothetical protein
MSHKLCAWREQVHGLIDRELLSKGSSSNLQPTLSSADLNAFLPIDSHLR